MTNLSGRSRSARPILDAGPREAAVGVPGVIDVQRGHKRTRPAALDLLDLPAGLDASGVPCVGFGYFDAPIAQPQPPSSRPLPGLAPTSLIASVEEVAAQGDGAWLIWGSVGDRPVLFAVEAGAAAEMMDSVAAGETATAIVEPCQLLLERLD